MDHVLHSTYKQTEERTCWRRSNPESISQSNKQRYERKASNPANRIRNDDNREENRKSKRVASNVPTTAKQKMNSVHHGAPQMITIRLVKYPRPTTNHLTTRTPTQLDTAHTSPISRKPVARGRTRPKWRYCEGHWSGSLFNHRLKSLVVTLRPLKWIVFTSSGQIVDSTSASAARVRPWMPKRNYYLKPNSIKGQGRILIKIPFS